MIDFTIPRFLDADLAWRLSVMPAVVLTGARQTGKTTIAKHLESDGRTYRSLDNMDVRELARRDPMKLLAGHQHITVDEVQREPNLLNAIKLAIDENRYPGRFLITGSANLLLMRTVSESLAGRAAYLTLSPLMRREMLGKGACGPWQDLLEAPDRDWPEILASQPETPMDWRIHAQTGGFPVPALTLENKKERSLWFEGYVRTYLERDLSDVSAIDQLVEFRRLMRACALRIGRSQNQAELARDTGIPQATVGRYLNLMELSYQLVRIPGYATTQTKRLIKGPKLYWNDTGLALHLAGSSKPDGFHLENLVLQDLLAWSRNQVDHTEIYHWRTSDQKEVDFVMETPNALLPIEVKASSNPSPFDADHLLLFRQEYGEKVRPGLLLHCGDNIRWIRRGVLAAPWWKVL